MCAQRTPRNLSVQTSLQGAKAEHFARRSRPAVAGGSGRSGRMLDPQPFYHGSGVAKSQQQCYASGVSRLTTAITEAILTSDHSAYAIAKGAGVARSQVSRMMRGQSGMTVTSVERLADYLGLEIVLRPKGRGRKAN